MLYKTGAVWYDPGSLAINLVRDTRFVYSKIIVFSQ